MGGAPEADRQPVPANVLDAAIDWQLRQGDGSSADAQALADWLAAHPDHARAWRQLGEIDRHLGVVGPHATRAAVLRPRRRPVRTASAALGLVLAAACGLTVLNRFQPVGQLLADHRTGTGAIRTVVLPDQTVLHLNTRSAVDVAFDSQQRAIRLRAGEIAVQTHHANPDEKRPFIVLTEDGSLRALGTRFVVRHQGPAESPHNPTPLRPGTALTVTQSAVAVRPAACSAAPAAPCEDERIVHAGQAVHLYDGRLEAAQAAPDADAWKDGMLVVDNQPLADVVATLARYRPGRLAVDPRVAQWRVTGTLPLADTDQALLALTAAVPVEVAYTTRWWVTLRPREAAAAP